MSDSEVLILGGGLAGISAALALAESGWKTALVERRRFLGGRAAAFPYEGGWLDNCQHVVLGCCINLLDLLEKLKTRALISFHESIPFFSQGKNAVIKPRKLPEPLHFIPDFLKAPLFSAKEKFDVVKLFSKLLFFPEKDEDLEKITMTNWLKSQKQSSLLIQNFWQIVLVSSVNENLERMSAKYGVMVLRKAFLPHRHSALMGTPTVPLSKLYHEPAVALFQKMGVKLLHANVKGIEKDGENWNVFLEDGKTLKAKSVISALPFYNLLPILPTKIARENFFARFSNLETSPILGIHLWFDRPISEKPFGALAGSPIHWFFVKPEDEGKHYVQLVVSASRDFMKSPSIELVKLGVSELKKYLPDAKHASLLKWHVVREARATFSAVPGSDAWRPTCETPLPNFFLAGDWTATEWPATMEGAVRSGYRAAERVLLHHGRTVSFLKEDLPPSGFTPFLPGLKQERKRNRKRLLE
jgi:squalene-associated FAD-dependent desaturase